MSVQRYTKSGRVRYRARVKHHGREVATQVFDRKTDAIAWEQEQKRRLHAGDWIDPKRGRIPLSTVAQTWFEARRTVKKKTQEADGAAWRTHIEPRFGSVPVAAITPAQVAHWVGSLVAAGLAPSTASRYLATLRALLAHAVDDGRIAQNPASRVNPPTAGRVRREGQFLSWEQLEALRSACNGVYADVAMVLGLAGLRWGEVAGLRVGDLVYVPGRGLRLQRAVLASSKLGGLYVDTLKGKRARTVPLVDVLVPIVDAWAMGKEADDWLFAAPCGGPLSESNWKRSVNWSAATKKIGKPTLRVHDLRHTCASVWLASGADPKVVQRILGHASAAMTMDLYGHLIDRNLWDAAKRLSTASGGTTGAPDGSVDEDSAPLIEESGL